MGDIHSHNQSTLSNLHEGDLIQFNRGLYSHWGVFVGGESVVHLAPGDGETGASVASGSVFTISGIQYNKAKVCVEKFWAVADNKSATINNGNDKQFRYQLIKRYILEYAYHLMEGALKRLEQESPWRRRLNPAEIVAKAKSKLGNTEYNLLTANCEHFAKWCRYGIPQSDQVDTGAVVAAVTIPLALVGLGYLWSKWNEKKKTKERKRLQQKRYKHAKSAYLNG